MHSGDTRYGGTFELMNVVRAWWLVSVVVIASCSSAANSGTTPRAPVIAPSCPSKDQLPKMIVSVSKIARQGKLNVFGCRTGRFGKGSWYVTAAVDVPAGSGEISGHYFLIRSVFDASGNLVVVKEDENDAMHPWFWESVVVQDADGDGVDEVIEELSGGGGVRRRNRDIYKIGDKLERTSTKFVGEYDPNGTFVPAE